MMRRLVVIVLLVAMCAGVLWGCNDGTTLSTQEPLILPQATETKPNESATPTETVLDTLPVATGSLETELLEITAWDSGRANETSGNGAWETEAGYYLVWAQVLYYADKTDVSAWVPVCSRPECIHSSTGGGGCDAIVPLELLLKDGRFYYNTKRTFTPMVTTEELLGYILVSMELDGTDKKLELSFEDAEAILPLGDEISSRSILFEDYSVYCLSAMDVNGLSDIHIYLADDEGVKVLFEGTTEESSLGTYPARQFNVYGDAGFFCRIIEGNNTAVYRVENQELVSVDLGELPREGAYLQGDTLRIFRPGDGYYQVDLTTREETRLSDAQLSNSQAHIVLPNCILESTLLGEYSLDWREGVETHAMKLFNGQEWLDVALPEELLEANDTTVLFLETVTSDRILLVGRDTDRPMWLEGSRIYQILLNTDTPTLEYLATIG